MRRRGALLLEVSIAAVIAATAMIAVAQLMAVAAHLERAIAQRRLAALEAANILERVMASPWEEVTPERLKELTLSSEAQQQLHGGQLLMEIAASTELPAAKQIVADVSWQDRAGEREHLRLTAWRFQPEQRP